VNEYTMIPFVVETYGGFGKEAVKLLLTLASHSLTLPNPLLTLVIFHF